jgi:hypothetical protein
MAGYASLVTLMFAASGLAGQSTTETDWPQWRGPMRNGIAGPGPKLLDSWPKDGPKLLWKSDPIPSSSFVKCFF